VTKILPMDNKG